MSAHHGRYPYRPVTEAVPYRWPHGEGLAVTVAVNLEAYAFDAPMLDELVANPARPDIIKYGWLDWGNRVGAWRLLEGDGRGGDIRDDARQQRPL